MGLRIAQVATTGISIQVLLLDQIKALQAAGHDVVAVCGPGPWAESVRAAGVKVETVPMKRELDPLDDLRALWALRDCFRRNNFDVVHTHTPKAGLIGPLAARLAGVPQVVHTIHGLLFHDQMSLMRRALFWLPEKVTASLCNKLLSQSREDVDRAVGSWLCRKEKITYLGNGIDLSHFASQAHVDQTSKRHEIGLDESDFVVGSVGRLVKEKGFMELFAAAEKVRSQYPQVRFVVIGPRERDQNDALDDRYMDDLQHRGVVRFVDWCDDVKPWYAAMDLFLLPSYREGIPRSCMEASAMMRAVVTSDIRGCREVVVDGETGILIPPRDVPQLVAAIVRLYQDRPLVRRMGERGRQHIITNFDRRVVWSRLCEFYSRLELEKRTVFYPARVQS